MTNSKKTIFEEYPTHGCDECERWWNNQCDGRRINEKALNRPCNEFLPTRNIEIPLKIKTLQRDVKLLEIIVVMLSVSIILLNVLIWRWHIL